MGCRLWGCTVRHDLSDLAAATQVHLGILTHSISHPVCPHSTNISLAPNTHQALLEGLGHIDEHDRHTPLPCTKDGGLATLHTDVIYCLSGLTSLWVNSHFNGTHGRHYSKEFKNAFESTQDELSINNNNRHSLHSSQHSSLTSSMHLPFFGI